VKRILVVYKNLSPANQTQHHEALRLYLDGYIEVLHNGVYPERYTACDCSSSDSIRKTSCYNGDVTYTQPIETSCWPVTHRSSWSASLSIFAVPAKSSVSLCMFVMADDEGVILTWTHQNLHERETCVSVSAKGVWQQQRCCRNSYTVKGDFMSATCLKCNGLFSFGGLTHLYQSSITQESQLGRNGCCDSSETRIVVGGRGRGVK
jgi:hypothetical protein